MSDAPFYVVAAILSLSVTLNVYVIVHLLRHFARENGKLQAAALARKSDPITAAVYQTYEPEDDRSIEMKLEDSKQADRDFKPLGL